MIKAILFDIDDTLLDFHECAKSSILFVCKKNRLPYSDKLFETFLDVTAIVWRQVETGCMTREKLRETRWQMIFEKLNISGFDPIQCEDDFRSQITHAHNKVTGALETVEALYPKYELYCASNAPSGQQEERMRSAGMLKYFKKMFVSGDIGLTKPTKEYFDYCFNNFDNLQKNEVIMVGDDIYADIFGAKQYGLITCYFNKYNKEIPSDIKPDYIINSISELIEILK